MIVHNDKDLLKKSQREKISFEEYQILSFIKNLKIHTSMSHNPPMHSKVYMH